MRHGAPPTVHSVKSVPPKCTCQLVQARLNALIEGKGGNRPVASPVERRQRDGPRLELLIEHGAARDLFPVVILGIDPEQRDDVGALFARHAPGQLNGGDGLEQGEERAAEGPCLLTCDDGNARGIGEPIRVGARFGWGAAAFLLRRKDSGNVSGCPPRRLGARDRIAPGFRLRRIPRKQRRHVREIERVVAGERPDPAESPHIDRHAGCRAVGRAWLGRLRGPCRRSVGWHRPVLSQSIRKHVKVIARWFDADRANVDPARRRIAPALAVLTGSEAQPRWDEGPGYRDRRSVRTRKTGRLFEGAGFELSNRTGIVLAGRSADRCGYSIICVRFF